MPEWLFEAGIGECRAALVEHGRIIEAVLDIEGSGPRLGAVAQARLTELLPGGQAVATLASGGEVLLPRVPPGITLGASLTVEVTREPIPEPGRPKRARAVATDAPAADGPDLLARLDASGHPVRHLRAHEPDLLEDAGWSELLDEAATGEIAFAGGALRMTPTPAMTLFDVDGAPPLEPLALAAATAIGAAIRRHAIGGSIGIDFPTLGSKAARLAVAGALDDALAPPFERTAVNGFGFLQIVRPRPRASLPELVRADPVGAAARAALRRMERTPPGTPLHAEVSPAVRARLEAHPDWIAELVRRTGRAPIWPA